MWTRITSNTDTFYAEAGFNSKVNDSGIWNKCSLLQAIGDRSVNLPEDDYLTNDCKLPEVFLGDDAFALKDFMMKPYPQLKKVFTSIDIAVQGEFRKTFLVYLQIYDEITLQLLILSQKSLRMWY